MTDKTLKIPTPIEEIPKHPSKRAGEEEAAMNRGDSLDAIAVDGKEKDHKRRQFLLNALNWGFIAFISVGILAAISLFGTWVWHLITPESCRWLGASEIQSIQTLLFSGMFSAVLTISLNNFRQ